MALGVPGRLRPRIISTFGTTRVVRRQPYASAAFTPGEIPGTHFQRLSRPQGTWFCRKEPRKKSPVTPPGTDPGTVRLVAQRLNHYATPVNKYCLKIHLCLMAHLFVFCLFAFRKIGRLIPNVFRIGQSNVHFKRPTRFSLFSCTLLLFSSQYLFTEKSVSKKRYTENPSTY